MKNLTPHTIEIEVEVEERIIAIPPSETIARVQENSFFNGSILVGGIYVPTYVTLYGDVIGLPEADEPVIVSAMVMSALKAQGSTRKNVYAPNTDIRNEKAQIIAVRSLKNIGS